MPLLIFVDRWWQLLKDIEALVDDRYQGVGPAYQSDESATGLGRDAAKWVRNWNRFDHAGLRIDHHDLVAVRNDYRTLEVWRRVHLKRPILGVRGQFKVYLQRGREALPIDQGELAVGAIYEGGTAAMRRHRKIGARVSYFDSSGHLAGRPVDFQQLAFKTVFDPGFRIGKGHSSGVLITGTEDDESGRYERGEDNDSHPISSYQI